jgi:chromosome segregation and condensation protein ScpB
MRRKTKRQLAELTSRLQDCEKILMEIEEAITTPESLRVVQNKPFIGKTHIRILQAFAEHKVKGRTTIEAFRAAGYSAQWGNTVPTLLDAGYLRATGSRRGRSKIYKITDPGRMFLDSLNEQQVTQ